MKKEVHLVLAQHPTRGQVLVLTSIEATAKDTQTDPSDWIVQEGWIPIEEAEKLPVIKQALHSGELETREVEDAASDPDRTIQS